jgi:inosine-uridine nucleoside N-ribohydrolase
VTNPAAPRKPIIIDCDPGHDDAVAILLAARHLEVLGITTVGGNQSIEKVTSNALKVLELGGLTHIPVAKGMAQPLLNQPRHAAAVHGETGLDGYVFPDPVTALDPRHGVAFIVETVMAREGVTIAPLGPLTNVATALRLEPRLAGRLAGIALMGGSAGIGNVTPVAEFNIWVDAEAAKIVFESGVPITMCGLNLTHQATVGEVELARLRGIPNPVAQAVAGLLGFYRDSTLRGFGRPVAYLHDPCAIATLIDETLFEFEEMRVDVETSGGLTYGMTVCDRRFAAAGPDVRELRRRAGLPEPNARVAMRLDHERFFGLLCETLATYSIR